MEAIKQAIKTEHLPVRESLVLATLDSIKAGIKLDDLEKQAEELRLEAARQQSRKKHRERRHPFILKKEYEEQDAEGFQQRTYRAHEDRRFAIMVTGDQHRRLGKDLTERIVFPEAPPLDFSFCLLNTVEEIMTQQEPPETRRNPKQPRKTSDDRYITSSLRLSYNVLHNFEGFVNILYKILETGPIGLCWLDLSFNNIDSIDEDTLPHLSNLCILYLHGNQIEDMFEVRKLKGLPALHTLTLHGNPIEDDDAYRVTVLWYMPYLKHLDFVAVTKGDRANMTQFGSKYQSHWDKKHTELVAKAEEQIYQANMSTTARLMQQDDAELAYLSAF